MDDSIGQLATLIRDATPGVGTHATGVPGVYLSRWSGTGAPRSSIDRPVFCVVAQGAKGVHLDGARAVYERGTYLLVSLDLPLVGEVVRASRAAPFLGITLELDLAEVGELAGQAARAVGSAARAPARAPRGVGVHALDAELLDAVTRLARLARAPAQAVVLAPLVRREIHYRLLLGPQGALLAHMADGQGAAARVAAGLAWLRGHVAVPVRMADLARAMHMSASTMHATFKAATGMTPLQFQKQLRLQEARRLLLTGGVDAATASRRVGYESPTQFSREYRRLFGAPPRRDVERVRGAAGALPALTAALEAGVPAESALAA